MAPKNDMTHLLRADGTSKLLHRLSVPRARPHACLYAYYASHQLDFQSD